MFRRTYRNAAGKSFSEGRHFRMHDFMDYYNSLTDAEWDMAVRRAAGRGYDISSVKPFIRVYCDDVIRPMGLEEVREKLLKMHGFRGVLCESSSCDLGIGEQRHGIEALYAGMGVPVPDYWREKLWQDGVSAYGKEGSRFPDGCACRKNACPVCQQDRRRL